MNYLQLVNRLREKVGAAGEGIATVSGQRGESLRLVDWVDEAWMEIQNFRNQWFWLRRTASTQTVAGQQAYTAGSIGITDFGSWASQDITLFDVSLADEAYLLHIDYSQFKKTWVIGSQTQGRSGYTSVNRLNELLLAPVPDKAYTLTIDYHAAPAHLAANTDTPEMPEHFHMAIVYLAMAYYGRYENAKEVEGDGLAQYYQYLQRIESNQLPSIMYGGKLI